MLEREIKPTNIVEEPPISSFNTEDVRSSYKLIVPLGMLGSGLALVICTLLMVSPLSRVVGSPIITGLSTSKILEQWGAWLPANFHLATDQKNSVLSTNIILFLLLTAIAFIIYSFSV